jgi:hypothetical protein
VRMRAHLTREKEAGRGKGKGTRVDAVLVDSSVVFLLLLSQLHPDDNLLLCGQCLHVLQNRAISASALPSTNAPFRVSFFQQVQPRGTPVLLNPNLRTSFMRRSSSGLSISVMDTAWRFSTRVSVGFHSKPSSTSCRQGCNPVALTHLLGVLWAVLAAAELATEGVPVLPAVRVQDVQQREELLRNDGGVS